MGIYCIYLFTMKFTDIVDELILEEFKDKGLLRFLTSKWFGDDATPQQMEELERLLTYYVQLKGQNRLQPQIPQIVTFLKRFPEFDSKNLPNAREYSLVQMRFLIDEFFYEGNEQKDDDYLPEILRGEVKGKTTERVAASKTLWYGQNPHLVVDEGDLRVYLIPNETISALFGYYEDQMTYHEAFSNMPHSPWCVARSSGSLWQSYRSKSDARTFYYLIDETKNPDRESNPEISQYYLSALQTAVESPTGFKITTIANSGYDRVIDVAEIVSLFPKMREHIDQIQKVEYDSEKELPKNADIVDRITERQGSQYYFPAMATRFKKVYIERGNLITDPVSWESMTSDLKQIYFDITESTNVLERFGKKLFDKIRSNKQELNTLTRRLKILGYSGIGYLLSQYIKDDYNVHRIGKINDNLMIVKTKRERPERFGLWNGIKGDWHELNGIIYEDIYTDLEVDFYVDLNDDNEKIYIVEFYTKTGTPDNETIVAIYEQDDQTKKGYFMTYSDWNNMVEQEELIQQGEVQRQGGLSPEKYPVMTEKEKGV